MEDNTRPLKHMKRFRFWFHPNGGFGVPVIKEGFSLQDARYNAETEMNGERVTFCDVWNFDSEEWVLL